MTRSDAIESVTIASGIQVFFIPFSGWLSDRVERRLIYAVGTIGAAIWTFVFFYMMQEPTFARLLIGVTGALICHSLMYGPQASLIAEQFSARLRYTGSSLAYTFAGIVGGAIAPILLTWFISFDPSGFVICLYIGLSCILTLIGLAMTRQPHQF